MTIRLGTYTLTLQTGDIAYQVADVLVSPASPDLKFGGGAAAALIERGGGTIRSEIKNYLKKHAVEPGGIVATGPGETDAKAILHAIALDHQHQTLGPLLRLTLSNVLDWVEKRKYKSLALPALGVGHGRRPLIEFLLAFRGAALTRTANLQVNLVFSRAEMVEQAAVFFAVAPKVKRRSESLSAAWKLVHMVEVLHSWGYEKLRLEAEAEGCSLSVDDQEILRFVGGPADHYFPGLGNCRGWPPHLMATRFAATFNQASAALGEDSASTARLRRAVDTQDLSALN